MGVPPLGELPDPLPESTPELPPAPRTRVRHSILGRRQAIGLALALVLLAGGRVARQRLLVGPEGAWRDELWLDSLLDPAPNVEAASRDRVAGAPADGAMPADSVPPAAPPPDGNPVAGVPRATPGRRAAARKAAGPAAPLDPNTATADSLQLLPGVGPVLAGRIVAARTAGTVFRGPGDLLAVKGIGPASLARLVPHLRFPAAPPQAAKPDNPH